MTTQEIVDEALRYVNENVRFWVVNGDRAMWLNVAKAYVNEEHPVKHMVTFMVKTYHIKITGVVR